MVEHNEFMKNVDIVKMIVRESKGEELKQQEKSQIMSQKQNVINMMRSFNYCKTTIVKNLVLIDATISMGALL